MHPTGGTERGTRSFRELAAARCGLTKILLRAVKGDVGVIAGGPRALRAIRGDYDRHAISHRGILNAARGKLTAQIADGGVRRWNVILPRG